MKFVQLALVVCLLLTGTRVLGQRFWVSATPSNWNNTANWSTTSGGAGGASVPGPADAVTFNGLGLGDCTLDIAPTVAGITINGYTGTIDINGFNLATTGTNTFTTGSVVNGGGAASLALNTSASTTFNGSTLSADVTGSTGRLFFNGSLFNGTVNVSKTDNNNDNSSGNNTFNGTTTITNLGGGQILLGNVTRDQFNGTTTFNNNGSYRFYFGHNHGGQTTTFAGDLTLNTNKSGGADGWSFLIAEGVNSAVSFGGNLTINCAGTLQSNHRILQGAGSQATYNGIVTVNLTNTNASTFISLGTVGTSVYNNNIVVSNSGGGSGILFNTTATAASTLAATKTISIGAGGFSSGTLSLIRFTQTGATSQTLNTFSGTARLDVGPSSSFGGDVTFVAPRLFLNGATIDGTATLEKTGATDDQGAGGNIFNGVTTITNSGSGYLMTGNGTRDQFNANTTFNNTGSYRIYFAHNHSGQTTTFGGDLTLNANKSGGADTYSYLVAENGTSAITVAGNLTINCSGAIQSNIRLLNGTGSSGVYSGDVAIDVTNSNASTAITMGGAGVSTYDGDIIVSNSGGASGIYFNSVATASSTLAATKTISIGGGGFSGGILSLIRFTQTGATAQTLTAFSGTASLIVGPSSAFGGDVNFVAPQLYLNGCTYAGIGTFEKTGATNNAGTGGNIFTGAATITNSGSGYFMIGNGTRDQFLSTATFNNTGSYRFYIAYNHPGQTTTFASDVILNSNKSGGVDTYSYLIAQTGASGLSISGDLTINCAGAVESDIFFLSGTGSTAAFSGTTTLNLTNTNSATRIYMGENGTSTYNGNIVVSNSGGASGITFNTNASASSILNGSISSGVYSDGTLNLYRFSQTGAFAQNLSLTNGTLLRVGPNSSFDGDVTFVASQILLNGATYNGVTYLEKNGATANDSNGGNTFNNATTLANSGSNYLLTANVSPDIFNGSLTVTNTGSSYIYLAHNVAGNQFNNNIIVNNTGAALGIIFSNIATGASTLTGGTVSVGGSGFSAGELRLRRFTQVGAIAQNITLTGAATLWIGPSSQFDGDVTFIAPQLLLHGATYNGTAYLEKNGAGSNSGNGGNIFNQQTTLVNSGSAFLLTAATSPDIFNADLIVTNSGSSTVRLADNAAGNQFNGDIELNSTFGGGIYFGNSASGTSTLAATHTIGVGSSGVISGDIRLIRFTQVGATAQTLNLSGIAILTLGPSSMFDGNIDFRAPQLLLNGTTYNGTAYLEKTGAIDNPGNGGNTFNSTTTLVNSGSGYLMTANVSADIFSGPLEVINTGSNIIHLAYNSAGSQFNGNMTFNSTLGSGGVYIANAGSGTATLGNGASLLVGALGFSSGELRFRRFTQIGSANQTLLLSGTALLRIGPSSTFNGNLDFRSPRIALDGAAYNGTTYLEKTGATNDDSSGGNVFNGPTTLANSGSGWFRNALSILDSFNDDLTLTNTGTSTIRMADNIPGTVFNGNLIVNSTNATAGSGILFCTNSVTATATLAAGMTISVGGSGFSAGELRLVRFTQLGATNQNLLLTGTSILYLGPTSTFDGDVDFRSPQLLLQGGAFNGTAHLQKTGASSNTGNGNTTFASTTTIVNSGTGYLRTNGNNIFNGTTTLLNSGSADLLLELTTASTYSGDVTFTNTGTSYVRVAYIGANTFNGNIQVNSTNGIGVYFCENAAGSATLANTKTISVGGTGFTSGELRLQRFTQIGGTLQNLALTGTATFRSGPAATWNGGLTVSSPAMFLDGSTLNGATNALTKTGATTDASIGGNTFAGNTTFTSNGTGIFRFANTTADDFSGNVTFVQASGTLQPAYNIASTFQGNVTVDGASAITFGANNGTITFSGGNAQSVSKSGPASPVFRRLLMNKSANTVTLSTDVSITTDATFTSGVLQTTAANYINFADNATSTGGSNGSHVDGPVRKTGNDAFTFPTGDNGIFRRIGISAPSNVAHYFTAEYFFGLHPYGAPSTYAPGILTVSGCEYWTVDRSPGGSNVNVTLSWNTPDCTGAYITDLPTLRVTRWNGTNWVDHGNGGTTGNATAGTVVTSAPITSFSPITLGSASLANPLPIELLDFTASVNDAGVELEWRTASEHNNDYFTLLRSEDGTEFKTLATIKGAGNTQQESVYNFIDESPFNGIVYYQLRQTDFDKKSAVVRVITASRDLLNILKLRPNPVNSLQAVKSNLHGDFIIINSLGMVVLKIHDASQLDVSALAPGVYTVRHEKGGAQRLVIY